MAKRKGSTNSTEAQLRQFPVANNQTIKKGDPLVLSSGKVAKAGAAVTAGFLGFAVEAITTTTATADDVILVDINPASIYEMKYVGTTKTSVAVTDIGSAFDFKPASDAIDLDDVTDAYFIVLGYDNEKETVDVIAKAGVRAI